MVTSYDSSPSAILKDVYLPPIRDTLNNKTILMKRLKRNTTDFEGNRGVLSLRTSRNPGVGARSAGIKLPQRAKQGHTSCYINTKNNYGRFYLDGENMKRTKGSRGAFARLVNVEIDGLVSDLKMEVNRQLFGDGSGFLAMFGTTNTTSGQTNTMLPYLWSPACKYLQNRDNLMIQSLDESNAAWDTLNPASSDTDSNAPQVTSSNTTNNVLGHDTADFGSLLAGDPVGIWRNVQVHASNTAAQYEMMGLFGICSDSDLVGDANWYYPGELSKATPGTSQAWASPEAVAGSYSLPNYAEASQTNNLQSIDAYTTTTWRGYVDGNAGVPRGLSPVMMNDMLGTMKTSRDANISLIVTTFQVQNKVADLLEQSRRYVNTMILDGGFEALKWGMHPIVVDNDCPRGVMFFLDESTLELFQLSDFDWIADDGDQVLSWIQDYDAFEACLSYRANLAVNDRSKNGMIVDINEA